MRIAPISKLFATSASTSESCGLFFCEEWYQYIRLILQKIVYSKPVVWHYSVTQFRKSGFSVDKTRSKTRMYFTEHQSHAIWRNPNKYFTSVSTL